MKKYINIFTALLVFICSVVQAEDYNKLFVFGDSLSDTGNVAFLTAPSGFSIPPASRYYQGRFSNGPIAAEMLMQSLEIEGELQPILALNPEKLSLKNSHHQAINLAFAGSETGFRNSVLGQFDVPGLLGQVAMFGVIKMNAKPMEDSLAFIWSGGNDYFNQYFTGNAVSADRVVGNIKKAIKFLYRSGIRHFMVPNLPDVGDVPIAHILAQLNGDNNIPANLSALTLEHNYKLELVLNKLSRLRGIKIHRVDAYSIAKKEIAPNDIFPGPASDCLYRPDISPAICTAVPFELGDGLIFWDETHTSTQVHQLFAEEFSRVLDDYENE